MTDSEAERAERAAFILTLRGRGIRDVAVLRALELVPRALFVDPTLRRHAYEDVALPIACGQTMSQPSLVAAMTEALSLNAEHKVLEIGTGSGYQAAVLCHLASQVVTVDRYRSLVSEAQVRFRVLGLRNVAAFVGDGLLGLSTRGPYDRIMITAAGPELAPALVEQLKPGGILVAPMGDPREVQMLRRFEKGPEGVTATDLMPVRFVPLVPGVAATL
ncbi:protein-L-isoaspartate O-methyltransferase [Azorhizobium oxalatiphilum]|uniref:Protein-L-isoaspartate O-methyltransferase n=1 Tax=Azorhizobium oxalatiphilum TaxID=980631 RepID=A0A917C7W0_9HYPH|nr:protein-L-isoaspartate(D-aspartate) O-methyltransferase [Azorhizobium oxalatiphilum]GGF72004.1 protein-L-isoaspartate O-methyltransferase [Azorhizobium oxalatiphilum]